MFCVQLQNTIKQKIDCLYDNLAWNKINVSSLVYRITNINSENKANSDIDSKFLMMLSQLEEHCFDEKRLLEEIEAMEKRHSELKEYNMLKMAESEKSRSLRQDKNHEEKEEKRTSLAKLLILWLLFRSKRGLFSFGKA